MKKILLLNDTSNWYHFGCTASSLGLKHLLSNVTKEISVLPINEIYKIEYYPKTADEFFSQKTFDNFCYHYQHIINQIQEHDIIIINGEGTIHGLRQAPLSLLYLTFLAKYYLKKHVEIVNHSSYPQDNLELSDNNAVSIYKLVYQEIDYVAIREPLSFKLIQNLTNKNIIQSFDSMPIYINKFYKTQVKKNERLVIVAGSATWLNLNLTSTEQGNIVEYEEQIKQFCYYLDFLYQQGYHIKFLLGAAAYPAKDEFEFLNFIRPKLKFTLDVLEAKTLDQWLGYIKAAKLLVSGRFHHTIAAACLRTKFIMLSSNTPKIHGLSQILDNQEVINYQDSNLFDKLVKAATSQDNENYLHVLYKLSLNNLNPKLKHLR